MKTNLSKMFSDGMLRVLSKSGTSEGAKLGWETRRGGAPEEEGKPPRKFIDALGDYSNVARISREINAGNPATKSADAAQVKKYTAHDFNKTPTYARINGALRGGSSLSAADQKIVDTLDRVVAENPSQIDAVVYRAISRTEGQPSLPEMKPGNVLMDQGYSSTSSDWTTGSDFQTMGKAEHRMLQIRVPKGTPALAIGPNLKDGHTENEVLLPRGTKFRVAEVKEVDLPHRGKREVYVLDVVPEGGMSQGEGG